MYNEDILNALRIANKRLRRPYEEGGEATPAEEDTGSSSSDVGSSDLVSSSDVGSSDLVSYSDAETPETALDSAAESSSKEPEDLPRYLEPERLGVARELANKYVNELYYNNPNVDAEAKAYWQKWAEAEGLDTPSPEDIEHWAKNISRMSGEISDDQLTRDRVWRSIAGHEKTQNWRDLQQDWIGARGVHSHSPEAMKMRAALFAEDSAPQTVQPPARREQYTFPHNPQMQRNVPYGWGNTMQMVDWLMSRLQRPSAYTGQPYPSQMYPIPSMQFPLPQGQFPQSQFPQGQFPLPQGQFSQSQFPGSAQILPAPLNPAPQPGFGNIANPLAQTK